MLNFDEVRLYNLSLRIVFRYIKDGLDLVEKNQLSEKELKEDFKFGKKDFELINENFNNEYFNYFREEKTYIFAFKILEMYRNYKRNYRPESINQEIFDFKEKFLEFKDSVFSRKGNQEYKRLIAPLLELAPKLHWHYLPIYSDNIVYNRGVVPENQPEIFYDHFHTLEDLYEIMTENPQNWKSIGGDKNLNKSLDFKVYTTRWGHYDNYKIIRTYFGWEVSQIMINGISTKTGFGKPKRGDKTRAGKGSPDL